MHGVYRWGTNRSGKLADLAFLFGSGRLNLDVEQRVLSLMEASGLRELYAKLKTATDAELDRVIKTIGNPQV